MTATFKEAAGQHGIPDSTLTHNGMVYTVRLAGLDEPRRPQRVRTTTPRLACHPEELPTQPPHHLRQGRTLPADHEELAPCPTRPTRHHRRAADPARPIPHRVQHHPATPIPTPPSHPRSALQPHAQGTAQGEPRHRHTRPSPPRQDQQSRHRHPARRRPTTPHRRRANYAGTYVILLVQNLDVRIVNTTTGELLRELTIDPRSDYQPTGRPPGPTPATTNGPTKS